MENTDSNPQLLKQDQSEIETLKSHLMELSEVVENQLKDALEALKHNDIDLAIKVVENEKVIDTLETAIEEEASRLLSDSKSPVGNSLTVLTILDGVQILNRIGNQATKITEKVIKWSGDRFSGTTYHGLNDIGFKVLRKLRLALATFVKTDPVAAYQLITEDKEALDTNVTDQQLMSFAAQDPRCISRMLDMMWIIQCLADIGDQAMSICNSVIHLARGESVLQSAYNI